MRGHLLYKNCDQPLAGLVEELAEEHDEFSAGLVGDVGAGAVPFVTKLCWNAAIFVVSWQKNTVPKNSNYATKHKILQKEDFVFV